MGTQFRWTTTHMANYNFILFSENLDNGQDIDWHVVVPMHDDPITRPWYVVSDTCYTRARE